MKLAALPGLAGLFGVALFAVVAVVGPVLLPEGALALHLARDLEPPSADAWLGFGENGVRLSAALVAGARTSFFVALSSTSVSVLLGTAAGAAIGFVGGKIDALGLRALDVLSAFPGILLSVYVAAVLPPSSVNVAIALSITGWVGYARVVRALVVQARGLDHVAAARALGAGPLRVLVRHALPLALGPVVVQASFGFSTAVLAEASLSFLGLGSAPGTPSWGALLDDGVAYLFVAPHIATASGACITLAVLSANLVGDALRDRWDPKAP